MPAQPTPTPAVIISINSPGQDPSNHPSPSLLHLPCPLSDQILLQIFQDHLLLPISPITVSVQALTIPGPG